MADYIQYAQYIMYSTSVGLSHKVPIKNIEIYGCN